MIYTIEKTMRSDRNSLCTSKVSGSDIIQDSTLERARGRSSSCDSHAFKVREGSDVISEADPLGMCVAGKLKLPVG